MPRGRHCVYCGCTNDLTKDHAISRGLYPPSKATSKAQRITVDACRKCNGGWSDDEAHFRSMMSISGDPTSTVIELWNGPIIRSFNQVDGRRRALDLFAQMVTIQTLQGERHIVYPGRDPRVLRIVRKIVRGLCKHHKLISPVFDDQVWADIQLYEVPPAFLMEMTSAHVEENIIEYKFYNFSVINDPHINSFWLLKFFNRTPFLSIVYRSVEAQRQLKA